MTNKIAINDIGDLFVEVQGGWHPVYTAAELAQAFREAGMVVISVEDLELAFDEDAPFSSRSARDRIRKKLKEAE